MLVPRLAPHGDWPLRCVRVSVRASSRGASIRLLSSSGLEAERDDYATHWFELKRVVEDDEVTYHLDRLVNVALAAEHMDPGPPDCRIHQLESILAAHARLDEGWHGGETRSMVRVNV